MVTPLRVRISLQPWALPILRWPISISRQGSAASCRRRVGGELAPDLHAEWIEAPRRHAARAAIGTALDLARHLEDADDPDQAVAVLQHAIAVVDPYNE